MFALVSLGGLGIVSSFSFFPNGLKTLIVERVLYFPPAFIFKQIGFVQIP